MVRLVVCSGRHKTSTQQTGLTSLERTPLCSQISHKHTQYKISGWNFGDKSLLAQWNVLSRPGCKWHPLRLSHLTPKPDKGPRKALCLNLGVPCAHPSMTLHAEKQINWLPLLVWLNTCAWLAQALSALTSVCAVHLILTANTPTLVPSFFGSLASLVEHFSTKQRFIVSRCLSPETKLSAFAVRTKTSGSVVYL